MFFCPVHRDYWGDLRNQRLFVDYLASRFFSNTTARKQQQQWYKVTGKRIANEGGHTLLNLYNGSLVHMFSSVYPEWNWNPSKFACTPRHFFSPQQLQQFCHTYAQAHNMRELDDWYNVTEAEVNLGGGSV